jgi:hypothetical protein
LNPGGNLGGGGGGIQRPNVVHTPGQGGGGLQIGNRPQINPGGGITRGDFGGGNRPNIGGGNLSGATKGIGNNRAGNLSGATDRRPGGGNLPNKSTTTLPGLGPVGGGGNRLGAGGAGERNPALANRPGAGGAGERNPGMRPGQGGAGERWTPGQSGKIPERHDDLSNRFDDHWGDSDWHHQQWEGPNGGTINHVGFWGPNGYWGHTGAWGPNGGHWGHSTGIGPNGAWGHTIGWGPNGNVWGHGGAIGPNGAFGWAGGAGPAGHWSRNWGGWYNGYAPCWGNGRWDYLWNNYPVAMAFGATMWGINTANWLFGVGAYTNPYYSGGGVSGGYCDYSQPMVGDMSYMDSAPAQTASTDDSGNPVASSGDDVAPPDPLTNTFNEARSAFYSEQFDQALKLTDEALKIAPRDAAINEFRGLCLFALGQYPEAAAVIHSVLAAGPGMDWTTMISLYSKPDTYTAQLRKLEDAVRANDKAADLKFLLAYHYITANHKDDAVALLKSVVQLQPKDQLSADLVKMYEPPAANPPVAASASSADNVKEPAWPLEKLQGDWTAKEKDSEFDLTLSKDDTFTWKFSQDGKPTSLTGAYTIRGNNLVLQPDSGGVLLSTIDLKDDHTLAFTPIGEGQKLTFTK